MKLILGDSLQKLKDLPTCTVDAIVTDPPAGISFMSKGWDSDKGGRDQWIEWLTEIMRECYRVMKPGAHGFVWAIPRTSHWTGTACERAGFRIKDCAAHIFGSGFPKSKSCKDIGRPELGSALKPAMELWWLIQKPLDGTISQNVLRWGTGALAIDACRIGTADKLSIGSGKVGKNTYGDYAHDNPGSQHIAGRWPANVLLDEEAAAMLDAQSGVLKSGAPGNSKARAGRSKNAVGAFGVGEIPLTGFGDSGGASRFFYCAKASKKERLGSKHPTIKPQKLMCYLVRLVSAPGQIILDPFMGSGTTGVACKLEGREFIGIDREEEYVADAKRRIEAVQAKDEQLELEA